MFMHDIDELLKQKEVIIIFASAGAC